MVAHGKAARGRIPHRLGGPAGLPAEARGNSEGRLDPEENSLLPGYLLHELDTRWAGRGEIAYEAKMDSTNIRAKELARSGAPSGSLALCDQQTAGRGRLQRRWETPAGVGR